MADQYTLKHLTWLGTYTSNTLDNDVITKVTTLTKLIYSGTGVFLTTMFTVMLELYETLEANLTHMKTVKLDSISGENVTNCCSSIVSDKQRLDSFEALKPENLSYICRILEKLKSLHFWI